MLKRSLSLRKYFLFAALVGLVSQYQNCSKVNFGALDSSVVPQSVRTFKPALATANSDCILCHGKIEGNLITTQHSGKLQGTWGTLDMYSSIAGQEDNRSWFRAHVGIEMTPEEQKMLANSGSGVSATYLTSHIKGSVYVPQILLPYVEQGKVSASLQFLKNKNILRSSTPASVSSVAEYLDAILNGRSDYYRNLLAKNIYTGEVNDFKDVLTSVREVASVKVGAYSVDEIKSLLGSTSMKSYPASGALISQIQDLGGAFKNVEGQVLECDGDLVFNGPVALKNLIIKSNTGCRIYSTSTIFVEAPAGVSEREGIQFLGGSQANLQLISARAVVFGLGSCSAKIDYSPSAELGSVGRRYITRDKAEASDKDIPVVADFLALRSKGVTLQDAGDCKNLVEASRKVHFKHVLVSAPEFQNRYTGDYHGVVIAPFILGAIGDFKYSYDDVFENVDIVPLLKIEKVFAVKE
ncbi:MAG: hypothetical protein HUU57_08010 [Bdellovibrio sp.]|nr:hypothetical protein [Bdellovibrio sp.]